MLKWIIPRLILADNIYVCANCGHKFKPNWNDFDIFPTISLIFSYKKQKLKCPECKIRDICRMAGK